MSAMRAWPIALALALSASSAGAQTALEVERLLRSPDAEERRAAAAYVEEHGLVPPRVAATLVDAASVESDHDTFVAMIRALGNTGAMEARALIDPHVLSPDDELRAAARAAMQVWLVRNGLLEADAPLDDPPHELYGAPPKLPPTVPAGHSLVAQLAVPPLPLEGGYSYPPPVYLAPRAGAPSAAVSDELEVAPGFQSEDAPRYPWAIAGGASFVTAYAASVIAGAVAVADNDEDYAPLFIPIAGPWVAIGTVSASGSRGFPAERAVEYALLALDGVAQSAGVVLGVYGLASRRTLVTRADVALTPGSLTLRGRL